MLNPFGGTEDSNSGSSLQNVVLQVGRSEDEAGLRNEIQRRHQKNLGGAKLGLEALKVLDPDTYQDVQGLSRSPRESFREWLDNEELRLGDLLPQETHPHTDTRREKMEIRWIGVAALVALLGGASLYALKKLNGTTTNRKHNPEPSGDAPEGQDQHVGLTPDAAARDTDRERTSTIYVAVGVHSRTVRDVGGRTLAEAPALMREGMYWWSGNEEEWEDLLSSEGLQQISEVPEADDKLLIIGYEVPRKTDLPSYSLEIRNLLKKSHKKNDEEADVVGTYRVSRASLLEELGFSR